ncbi:transcription factor Tfb2-domain-containing protein [Syncephalis pseudoplumigaleata]|uniref:RNA polymerase II transcription factor B subunit 2 n=1 Tax=Syncephalis pseudoplumigaleata TaxID=1712513 RepID=A0A4P9Z3Y6_9FUNG|nr:transcription factor Tfb2-domain-containing protein [Syncephalis pseudoplumigaleata]|eukprot:RKP26752.1 transcription factor Tfb2-domain-containing protein [Syncephalis pseudoplumigaleata]
MPTANDEQSHFRTAIDEYLETLPAQTCQRLYQSPASCLAVFRLLPDLAKQLVMSLLYVPTDVSMADMAARCFQECASQFNEGLQKLLRLHIIEQIGDATAAKLRMNAVFGRELRNALTGGGEHGAFGVPCDVLDKHPVDEAFLDQHATQQWEAILHFMIGTAVTKRPGRAALNLLRRSGLMASSATGDADSVSMAITNKGFQFLLQDVNTQMWAFLLQYLDMVQDLGMDLVEVLNFLFQLGTLELGKDYSVEPLTETQRRMLDDLQDYGLCYRRKKGSRRFYPTRLAITLASGNSASLDSEQNENGYIILETNYRVYAYTDSPLQIAVLSLFCTMRSRFQNMVCGAITRESIRSALANGITSDQIVTYLTTHAHPLMRQKIPVLPLTVIDQIRLWEMEKNRLQTTQGFLYQQFARQQDFDTVLQYAQELGVVVWYHPAKRMLVVTDDGHVQVRAYVQRRKNKSQPTAHGAS